MLEKVISGGQTGVDRAALDAAIEAGIPHGGWCPKGRIAHDGVIPDRYNLKETTTKAYPPRTALNVRDADGTLIIIPVVRQYKQGPHVMLDYKTPSRGTTLTIRLAKDKPHLIIGLNEMLRHTRITDWVIVRNIRVLNVAGPSEREGEPIYKDAYLLLLEVFRYLKRGGEK